mgnify:FL=1|tara:strand:+ start:763 stop:1131 length:369 start_codon:yes stop_codon:yes gene_type:complete
MKLLTIALGLAGLVTTGATAADFPVMGQTLSLGAQSDTSYTTGVETWAWDVTPYAGATVMGVSLLAETKIDVLTLDEGDIFTGVDLTFGYAVPAVNVNLYTEVSSDKDFTFGDVTMGAKIKF